MDRKAVLHIPMSEYAHSVREGRVVIRLRTARDDLASCTLYYGDRACRLNPVVFTPIQMQVVASDRMFDYYEAEFDSPYTRLCYYFELCAGDERVLYYGDLFSAETVPERSEYYQFPYIHRADIAAAPDWASDAVIYNIFPDSFATSRRFISEKAIEKQFCGRPVRGKLGGTIRGIKENADYLSELGINCIYINPIFTAGEYSKYDLLDYFSIDPCFGTNQDFADLVDEYHRHGIRVIIDGVFNHCGWHFFAFEDAIVNGEKSRYWDWFYRLKYPVVRPDNMEDIPEYECFAYERLMPKLNTANPEVVDYFCQVCQYWLREYKIDGWRLDVASEVDDAFWRAFRKAALDVNPNALLIGEVWESAGHWLDGSMFNSSMNYDFRKHCREFFARGSITAEEFASRVTNMLMRYRKNLLPAQLNLLDSHDVSRFLSLCDGDEGRFKLAVLFQMCFIGIPSIYYGDEQGITGLLEEEYRSPMRWDGGDLLGFYQQAISLRKEYAPLRRGIYKTLDSANPNLFVFSRELDDQRITVAMNVGTSPVEFRPGIGNVLWQSGHVDGMLAAYGFIITESKVERR